MRIASWRKEVTAPQPARVVFKSADNQSGNGSSCRRKWAFTAHAVQSFPAQRLGVTQTSAPVPAVRLALPPLNIARTSIKRGGDSGRRREVATHSKLLSDFAKYLYMHSRAQHTSDAS